MGSATRKISARERNFILYSLYLAGEVKTPGWGMQVDRQRLARAVEAAVRGSPLCGSGRRRRSRVVLTVCDAGLSVRSAEVATDIPAIGIWASPIAADGLMVLRVLARITDDRVQLEFYEGRLGLNERSVRAREI